MTDFKLHNDHLMNTIGNMVQGLNGVDTIILHSNTIKVIGDGLEDALQNIVDQVPVLDMKLGHVNPKNVRHTDKEVHIIFFTSMLLEHNRRMHGTVMGI